MNTQTDLAELRRLHEAATKGEWAAKVGHSGARLSLFLHRGPNSDGDYLNGCGNDVELIAAAHNALPALLDELEAARLEMRRQGSVIAELREELRRLTQANGDLRKERDRAVKEAQRQHGVAKVMRRQWVAAKEEVREVQNGAALQARDRRQKLIGAADELEQSAKTLREDLADMNPPEFASRGKVAPGYCECLQDVADGMEERAAKLRQEAEGE